MRRHDAYTPEVTRALYDGGVRSFDRRLGELLDFLDARGLDESTLVVLTSDHGEQLGEEGRPSPYGDGFYNVHGHTLYEEMIRVPLIVRRPGSREGRRIHAVTASIDVLPTILELVGVEIPSEGECGEVHRGENRENTNRSGAHGVSPPIDNMPETQVGRPVLRDRAIHAPKPAPVKDSGREFKSPRHLQ